MVPKNLQKFFQYRAETRRLKIVRSRFTALLISGSLLATGWLGREAMAEEAHTYYYQLICGSNKPLPASDQARPVGLKLRSRLDGKFRWNIWTEVSHGECSVSEGKTTTIKFPDKREMQIDVDGKTLEARLYRAGQLVRRSRENAHASSLMMGGDQAQDQAWFIVIRSDKPSAIVEEAKGLD